MTALPRNAKRNRRILRLAGKKSYTIIGEQVGVTRDVVAGVIWRERWPSSKRHGRLRTCGNGHNGPGAFPAEYCVGGPQ